MKNHYLILYALLTVIFLAGCKASEPVETVPFSHTKPGVSPMAETRIYTENDIIEIFNAEDGHTGYSSTGCVVVDDSAYELIGIIQYTDDKNNPCNLAFVKEDGWSYPIGVAAEGGFSISEDSVLLYLGNGKVGFSLMESGTQKVFDYTVEYSASGDNTHFEVSSTERK